MSRFSIFLHSTDSPKEKSRTINIKRSTHEFYKQTANFYDINITTLVSNVLDDWMETNKEDIKKDMIEKLETANGKKGKLETR